jgi:uncharacterized iron-regulated protein
MASILMASILMASILMASILMASILMGPSSPPYGPKEEPGPFYYQRVTNPSKLSLSPAAVFH